MGGDFINTEYGNINRDFDHSNLNDLVARGGVQTGPFGSQLHAEDYVEVGTPIITVEHLGDNRIIHSDLPRVSDEDRKRLSRFTLQYGDIVFSRVGSVDRRALVRKEETGWLFSGRCLRVRPDSTKIDPEYLSYFFGLPTFKEYIRKIAVGATMPSLNTKILSNIRIYYPPLPEQRAIAAILGALDDKIELNRRMNRTLEAMARALFKHWFVDGAEEGWEECSFLDVADLLSGGTPKTSVAEYWNGDIYWVSAKDVSNAQGLYLLDTEKRITQAGIDNSNTKILPVCTTIVTARGTVGSFCMLGKDMA